MADLAPEIYAKIKESFDRKYAQAQLFGGPLSETLAKINNGTATFRDADLYAVEVGSMMADAMKEHLILEDLPEKTLYRNIAQRTIGEGLKDTYGIVSNVARTIQEEINAENKIGLKAVQPKLETGRVDKIVNRAVNAKSQKTLDNNLTDTVPTFARQVVDDTQKANARLHNKAGLNVKVEREYDDVGLHNGTDVCDWCMAREGKFDYEKAMDVGAFERHEGCGCIITYTSRKGEKTISDSKYGGWEKPEEREARIAKEKDALRQIETEKRDKALAVLTDLYQKYGSQENIMLFGTAEDMDKWFGISKSSGLTEKDVIHGLYQDVDKWESVLSYRTDDSMKRFTEQLFATASDEEIEAMRFWSGGSYGDIQRYLRGGVHVDEISRDAADKIVAALGRIKTPEELIVKRGTGTRHMFSNFGEEWRTNPNALVGKVFSDDGLVATSPFKSGGFSGSGANQAELFIRIPKGAHGAYIADAAHNELEKEFLLQRGYSYRIIKAEYRPNIYNPEEKDLKVWAEVILK